MLVFHTLISLVMLVPGFVVVNDLMKSHVSQGWTAAYLVTAVLTSATGFLLPAPGFLPSHGVGIISLVLLAVAIVGLYVFHLAGAWRGVYAASIVATVYFDVFVAVVQAFRKVPFLHVLAPTESELPFAIAQLVVLIIFVWLGFKAVRAFRPVAV